jgi:hypothetical protein
MSKEKFVRDKPHVNIGTISLIIVGIISAVSLGVTIYLDVTETRDSDGDSIPDLEEDISDNPLFFDISDDALNFRTYEATSGNHEVGHNLGISHDGISSHVNVFLGVYDDVSTATPLLDFNIKYDSLIEFVDADSNGLFDPATDTIVGKTMLNNMLRLGFGYGVDGEPVYYSNYSTIDGVFKVDFYTAREHILLGRQVGSLSPFELKSFITFTEYTQITGGTKLALNLSLSSSHDINFSGTTLTAKSSTGNYEVEYEWYEWAIIDGVERRVNTTVPSSPVPLNIGSLYINFGEVVNGTYDPKLQWQIPRSNRFSITDIPWSYITIGSLALLTVGMAAKKPRVKKKSKPKPKPPTNKFDTIASQVQSASSPPSDSTDHVSRKKPGRVKYQPITTSKEAADKVPRKRPGRVKYSDIPPSSKKSTKTATKAEKRIPNTIRHRDR